MPEQATGRSVAIVGASANPERYSHRAVIAYARAGWRVIPVHPGGQAVAGHACARRIEDLAEPVDLCCMYVNPRTGAQMLPAIIANGCRALWLNPGADESADGGPELVAAARAAGMRVVQACSLVVLGWGDPWAIVERGDAAMA